MKKLLFTFIVLVITLSCNSPKEQPQPNVPKALQEQKSTYSLISKRSDGDLVESIYGQITNETPALKKLEEDIEAVNNSKEDSLETYEQFSSKNKTYYGAAQNHTGLIRDSVLRESMKTLVESSLSHYNALTSAHEDILKSIASKETSLSDLHVALKIIKTLPVIGNYQKDNLPNTKSLEGYSQQQAKTINTVQKLSRN